MAMKKRPDAKKPQRNDDTVIYRAGVALVLACIVLFALQQIELYYPLTSYFLAIQSGLLWGAGIFGLIALTGLVGFLALRKRNRFWGVFSLPAFLVGAGLALCCIVLYRTWYQHIPVLFFLVIAVGVLYLIYLLYQPEFFLLSVVNVCAGGVFYRLSCFDDPGVAASRIRVLQLILAAAVLICAALVFLASRNDGKLRLPGGAWRAISRGGTALLIYITGAVWLVCLIAGMFVGAVLSYYCVFAAVAFELAAAVYYTIKLA